jgi:DNA-binding beta-propeller fold protein YncE
MISLNHKNLWGLLGASLIAFAFAGSAQQPLTSTPDLQFDSVPDLLKMPDNLYLGEVAGVATNSKNHIFVFTRTGSEVLTVGGSRAFLHGGSRLFEFDENGGYVREIGHGIYGFMTAHAVRVDREDNIWAVDEQSNIVIKFAPDGEFLMTLGRKPESVAVPAQAVAKGPGLGIPGDSFSGPTDIAWDAKGNSFVADGSGNARIVKLDSKGNYIKAWGGRGTGDGQLDDIHTLAVDAQGNVYAGDRGNNRIDVFDNDGNYLRNIQGIGVPTAICISPGPHQYLYTSNSNSPIDFDHGEIYKLDLNGKILGKFGTAGKRLKEFGSVHEIDCREKDVLFVGELGNWRVQKLILHPAN